MRRLLVAVALLLLSGCGANQFSLPSFGSSSNLANAKASIAAKDWYPAFFALSTDLEGQDPSKREAATKLIAETPGFLDNVYASVEEKVRSDNKSSYLYQQSRQKIDTLRRSKLFTQDRIDSLEMALKEATVANVMKGDALYDLSDIVGIEALQDPRVVDKLFADTVAKAEQNGTNQRNELLAFYEKLDPASPYRKRIADLVPKLRYTVADLRSGTVSRLFPEFASARLAQLIVPVRLATDPSRRLVEEDVGTRLARGLDQVVIVKDGDPQKGLTIVIKELELTERSTPESTQTTVVDYYNVNIMAAVLLLPRNASVLFDVRRGGAALEFAYEIVVKVDDRIVETKLVRDRLGAEYHECSNMRFQNVFGGVGAFNLYPNPQVESFCRSGGSRVSPSSLKEKALDQLTRAIMDMKSVGQRLAQPWL